MKVRAIAHRHRWFATYALVIDHELYGVTLFRRRRTGNVGAVSLLAPIGRDGVPVQVVFGDWWRVERDA